jgi:hypothetical protein
MLVDGSNSLSALPGDSEPELRASRRKRNLGLKGLSGVRHFVEELPGWWLSALLVMAPWAYGTTFYETRDWLAVALCGLSVPFAISLILQRRWPRINWISILLPLLILTLGWLMTWNASLIYDRQVLHFHHISQPISWLPGTVDQATSRRQMLLITGLFFAFWVASDLTAREPWRQRLWLILSLTGVSVVVLGLLQRVTAAPGIFWRTDLDCGQTFFATYRYHANAGAFINIIFPFVAAQSICAFRKSTSELARAFWLVATLCVLVSALVNVSRAAAVVTVCLALILVAWQLVKTLRSRHHSSKRQVGLVAVIVVVGAAALLWAIGFGDAYKRWTEFGNNISANGRYVVYDLIEHRILPRSGWWGFGPANFSLVFPFFTNRLGTSIEGYWEYAHEDYLQCLVEWGFAGATVWFLFFGHTMVRAIATFWRRRRVWDGRMRTFVVACFLALGGALIHSAVDFPLQIASLQLYAAVIMGFLASLEFNKVQRSHRFKAIANPAVEGRRPLFRGLVVNRATEANE